ncbi:MAG: hypothetical protein KatS3mg057_0634 [Herpetosiphonaceae bacterium]|nr:MAG: hypothetical protein KatS3mg057_0634 [Herpetosiphonaceae bacterium]
MCRSIKNLRRPDASASDEELHAAALQFVRKVTGYRVPSQANRAIFDQAVLEIAAATRTLLDGLARHGRHIPADRPDSVDNGDASL